MRLLLLLTLVLTACPERIKPHEMIPDAGCGDGDLNPTLGEECEGSDLDGKSCQSLGFDEGTLSCSACKLVTTLCTKRCGNGKIDTGEACDGDAGISACTDFGYVSCTATCTVDQTHCVTTAFAAANGALTRSPGGPTAVGDLPPHGLGELVMLVPDRFRVEAFRYTVQQAFNPTDSLNFASLGDDPVQAIALGDDVIARNRDGTLDRYRYAATGYVSAPFADAGCSGQIVGALANQAVATSSCDGGELLVWGADAGVLRGAVNGGVCSIADFDRDGAPDVLALAGLQLDVHRAPAFSAADAGQLPLALTSLVGGDFDGDGDLDLAGIAAGQVKLLENTGIGYADRLTLPATGAHDLHAADLDLDGQVDLVWEAADKVLVRRNQGSWVFAPFEATVGSTAGSLSFSVGDVDGDGDLDLVSTRQGASTSSVTYVQLNRVR
ncbi:MAG: VCBS repeat-containing protein [Archangiaceae bacterium]|nr:VCBS repeat-containing protein [Archangiaceae bacterium]